jgi:signal transduction histidine kinase
MPIEFEYRHQDGSWRTIEAISQKFIDNNSDNIDSRIVVNCRDITERKRLDEIRLALEKEKELSALKIRFFSMASHEFRTPLSTALAAAQLLETSQTTWENTEKRLRNLHRIQNAVKNMVQLLDDILTINRAETGRLEFSPQLFNLKEFCQKFIEEIQLGLGTQHLFNFQCQGDNITVNLDQKLLRSILSNLLSNAVKYSPLNSQIDVLIKFESQQVLITIKDQGIGISAADQEKLFEPFHRGNNVQNIPGTGLGLIVTKKCVDLHKGTMMLKSEVDLGTTVIISLPVG